MTAQCIRVQPGLAIRLSYNEQSRRHMNRRFYSSTLVISAIGAVLLCAVSALALYSMPERLAIITVQCTTALVIFMLSALLIFRLWSLVIDALSDVKTAPARALLQLVGGIDVEGNRAEGSNFRLTGVGLLGTFGVFVGAAAVVYMITTAKIIASDESSLNDLSSGVSSRSATP
jgi:hypothetical protein